MHIFFGCESTFWETRGFAHGFGMLHQVVIASRWIWHWTSIGWGPWGVNQGWSTFPYISPVPRGVLVRLYEWTIEPSIFVHFLGGFGVPQVWPKTQLMVVGDCPHNFWVIFKPFGWLGSFKGTLRLAGLRFDKIPYKLASCSVNDIPLKLKEWSYVECIWK